MRLMRCRDDNNFAPRVGFAWDIKGDQTTVLRGGYGIYYQRLSNQNILQNSLAAPFTVQPLDNRAVPTTLQLANPLAGQPPPSIVATALYSSADVLCRTAAHHRRRTAGHQRSRRWSDLRQRCWSGSVSTTVAPLPIARSTWRRLPVRRSMLTRRTRNSGTLPFSGN